MLWVPFWTGGIQRLNDEQLDVLSASIAPLFQYLEQEVITDIARRIKKTMTYTRTAELMAMEMQRLGYSPAKIRTEAMKRLQADVDYQNAVEQNTIEYKQEIKKLIEKIVQQAVEAGNEIVANAGNMSWIDDMSLWESNGRKLGNNSFLHQLQDAFSKQTAESMKNLTGTTGFKTMSGYESVMNAYRNELDKAAIKICSGTFSQETVIREVIKNLSQSGLRSIDFASGRSMQLDTAVKLAVRTGCGQLAAKIHDQNILNTGQNLIYVSEHWGARNTGAGVDNHEKWQGRVYYIKSGNNYSTEAKRIGQDYITDIWYATGYSPDGSHTNDPRGLHGYNCRHNHYVWFEGTSALPDKNPQPGPVTIGGKTYDYYAMTQKMRAMERNIRALKREKEALQALGQPATEVKAKLSEKTREYRLFCKQCKIKENSTNLRYECGTADLNKTKVWKRYQDKFEEDQRILSAHANDLGKTVVYDESRSYSIDLEGYSEPIRTGMRKAAMNVAKYGTESHYEYMELVNLKTGELSCLLTDELPNQVGGKKLFDYLKMHPDEEYAFIHNHNTATELSLGDIELMVYNKQIQVVAAVRNDGIISVVESNGRHTDDYISLRYQERTDAYRLKKYGRIVPPERLGEYNLDMELFIRDLAIEEFSKGGMIFYE